MGGLLGGLAALAGPIVARVLLALGMSVVTVSIGTASLAALKTTILQSLGGLGQVGLGLAGLFGVWIALGAIFGAFTFAITFWGLTKATSILGTAAK